VTFIDTAAPTLILVTPRKYAPEIVTPPLVPGAAHCGLIPVINGTVPEATAKLTPLLAKPFTTTVIAQSPSVTPGGTAAVIAESVQFTTVAAATVPNMTLLPPLRLTPNFAPTIVTNVPVRPDCGDTLVIVCGAVIAYRAPLLLSSKAVTTTSPL
jgi:hypothetical protein